MKNIMLYKYLLKQIAIFKKLNNKDPYNQGRLDSYEVLLKLVKSEVFDV